MLSLLGAPALSQFLLEQQLRTLQSDSPDVSQLRARWVHFVDTERALSAEESALLERLLTYGPRAAAGDAAGTAHQIWVTPRVGTESPWSSKATDIAHVCGLDAVKRLERGTLYYLDARPRLPPPPLRRMAAALHDRMTESAWVDEAPV